MRITVLRLRNRRINKVGSGAGDEHHDTHNEDPHQQLHLHHRILNAEQDKRDECHASDAVGFKSVGTGANRISGVVAGAIGNYARVAGIIFLNLEDDLHQIGADVGDLGENAACDTQGSGAERFADRKTDEARAGIIAGNKEQDDQHHEQFDADQHHANAHTGFQRNLIAGKWLAGKGSECGTRVGKSIYSNAEPGHTVAAPDSDEAKSQNDGQRDSDRLSGNRRQYAKIKNNYDRDENPQQHQELALSDEVSLAGLVNQFRNFPHRAMHRQIFQLGVNDEAEKQTENAKENSK